MRFILFNLLTAGLMLFGAASAGAVSIFFDAPSSTSLNVGEQVTIQLRLDTEGETEMTSVFVSTFVDPSVLSFDSGTSPGAILLNFSTFQSLAKASDPFVLGSDPAGNVRAASFGAVSPSGVASANQLLATLTFTAAGPGVVNIASLIQPGDDVTVNGVSISGAVGLGQSLAITVVPEPGTALLMGLGLAGLGAAGRRK